MPWGTFLVANKPKSQDLVWKDWLADTRGEQHSTVMNVPFFDDERKPRFERHPINKERGMNLATGRTANYLLLQV
jgi:hypothetical protein